MEAAKKLQSYFISLQREDQPTAEEMLRKVYFISTSYSYKSALRRVVKLKWGLVTENYYKFSLVGVFTFHMFR